MLLISLDPAYAGVTNTYLIRPSLSSTHPETISIVILAQARIQQPFEFPGSRPRFWLPAYFYLLHDLHGRRKCWKCREHLQCHGVVRRDDSVSKRPRFWTENTYITCWQAAIYYSIHRVIQGLLPSAHCSENAAIFEKVSHSCRVVFPLRLMSLLPGSMCCIQTGNDGEL